MDTDKQLVHFVENNFSQYEKNNLQSLESKEDGSILLQAFVQRFAFFFQGQDLNKVAQQIHQALCKSKHLIFVEVHPKKPVLRRTRPMVLIVRLLEKAAVGSGLLVQTAPRTWIPIAQLLQSSPMLKQYAATEAQVIQAFGKTSSNMLFMRVTPAPAAVSLISSEELVAQSLDYLFGEKNYAQDAFLKSQADAQGQTAITVVLQFAKMKQILANVPAPNQIALVAKVASTMCRNVTAQGDKLLRVTREQLVAKQVEFYFSDDNYSKDKYLREQEGDDGWIAVGTIFAFPKLIKLCESCSGTIATFVSLLRNSSIVEVSPDGLWLRKKKTAVPVQPVVASTPNYLRIMTDLIQFYFGDMNYPMDKILRASAEKHPQSFVLLQEFCEFPRMKILISEMAKNNVVFSIPTLLNALKDSIVVEVDMQLQAVRRKNPFKFRRVVLSGVDANTFAFQDLNATSSFTCMTYNVLANMYCNHATFPYAHPLFLDWESRKRGIVKEISFYSPDVLCLQEVQAFANVADKHAENHVLFFREKLLSNMT